MSSRKEAGIIRDAEDFLKHHDHEEACAVDSAEAIDLVRELLAIARRQNEEPPKAGMDRCRFCGAEVINGACLEYDPETHDDPPHGEPPKAGMDEYGPL